MLHRRDVINREDLRLNSRLKNRVFKISASQKFETVVKFLRKKLDCKETDSVFCYVNSVFAPGLDEGVGGLWRVCLLIPSIAVGVID